MAEFYCTKNGHRTGIAVSFIILLCFSPFLSTGNISKGIGEYKARQDNSLIERLQLLHNSQSTSIEEISNRGNSDHYEKSNLDRYIVALRDGSSASDRAILIDELKKKSQSTSGISARIQDLYNTVFVGFSISVPKGDTSILKAIQNHPRVLIAEKDQRVQLFAQSLPTGINRVDGDLSTAESGNGRGNVGADIAIMDSGVDLNHPDLNIYRERTFVSGTLSAEDDNGHGTHVAGIAAAKDNDIGVVGIAPGARIWAVKVLDSTGTGFISDIIAGIDYLTQNAQEVDVVNMSFGCECTSPALDEAISNSIEQGIVYVVAAGNNARDASTFSPANNVNVIAVSAIVDTDGRCGGQGPSTSAGGDDTFASFSNFGSPVDIAAPGVIIYSTIPDDSYATMSGTSMATPHVAGAAALLKSIQSSASPSQIKDSLISGGSKTSTICDGNGHGYFTGDPDQAPEPLMYIRHQQLIGPATFRASDIVSSNTFYEIIFITATTGTIHTVDIVFPPGTLVGGAGIIDRVGIGPGTLTKSGTTVTFHVATPEVIPAGTYIRLEMVDIKNPPTPGANNKITVTTRGPNSVVIDGPSLSPAYNIKQIGGADIAPDSIVPFVNERSSEIVSVPPLTFGFAQADCLPNERVVGGGFLQVAGAGGTNLLQTFREIKAGNGWNVVMFNPEPFERSFSAKAECMPALP